MSLNANTCTIALSGIGYVEVCHTPAEVKQMCEEARRKKVGMGEKRKQYVADTVTLNLLTTNAGRPDADYRKTIEINPEQVGAILPLDERCEPFVTIPMNRADHAIL